MCMITRCWSFWCLHFSFTENNIKGGGAGSYMSTTLLHLFTPQQQEDRPGSRSRRANNWWTVWPPHTWQVCGIGRGNHSVGLGWALCFHLGQWCRRGNFQPQPDSLSARWKTSTSWKWKQLWGRPIRGPGGATWHPQTPWQLTQHCFLQLRDEKISPRRIRAEYSNA